MRRIVSKVLVVLMLAVTLFTSPTGLVINQLSTTVQAATLGEQNALASAKNYLSFMAFSKKGLKQQLVFDGYTESEAAYAVKNCKANWKKQAKKSAENYLSFMSFSKKGLIDQLKYDGFTKKQAEYAAKAVGY